MIKLYLGHYVGKGIGPLHLGVVLVLYILKTQGND